MISDKNLNLNLQLGDIIKLISTSNESINNKIYYIKFINNKKIKLLSPDEEFILDISEEGKILEESIDNIILLHRNESNSYVIQNNLTLNSLVSIYFGEPEPFILNAKITNIEEDMIELTDNKTNNIYYIDFCYSGIPENLNIEKIIVRDIVEKSSKDDESNELNLTEKDAEEIYSVEIDKNDYELNFKNNYDNYEEIILDSIEFEKELDEIFYSVNVTSSEKRYSIEDQIDDYLNKEIELISSNKINDKLKNDINFILNRYLELRNLYSDFDVNGSANKIKLKDIYYKPIIEEILKQRKNIFWILPIITSKKNLIIPDSIIEEVPEEDLINDNMNITKHSDFINDLLYIRDKWSNNFSKDTINSYSTYINNLYDIFESKIENNTSNFNVNGNILCINDTYDDFNSYSIKNNKINKTRFIYDVCDDGYSILESYYENNKKKYNNKEIRKGTNIKLDSFLVLTDDIIKYSIINNDYTDIYTKTNLSNNILMYNYILNENTLINKFILYDDNIKDFKNTDNNIQTTNLFENIHAFSLEKQKPNLDDITDLLESFIPINSKIINYFIKDKNIYNYTSSVNILQAFNIDFYNIHNNDFILLSKLLKSNISNYITSFKTNELKLRELIETINKNLVNDSTKYSFEIFEKSIYEILVEVYKLNNINFNNSEELYNYCLKIDNAKFFYECLNKNIIDLLVSNLVNNFIKQKDEITIPETENCEKYYLSKKYSSIEELNFDNDKTIFFDTIYDKTLYNFIDNFTEEQNIMEKTEFFEFLKEKISKKFNISKKEAHNEATAIINQKREVIEGCYALLIDNQTKKNYIYIRKNNSWVLDENFGNDFYIDSNEIFCNSNKDCISFNDKCLPKDRLLAEEDKNNIDLILDSFNKKYDISIEELKGKVAINYDNAYNYAKNIKLILNNNLEEINNKLLAINTLELPVPIVSPYKKLLDKILSIPDITKRYSYIKTFCLKFTREAYKSEEYYWYYCKKSNLKLIPSFLLKLANTFEDKRNYLIELDNICATRGTISDSNNCWVDKYSGYVIKYIEYSNDEGYDESGLKLHTRELMNEDFTFKQVEEKDKSIVMIENIVKSVTKMININLENKIGFIVNNVKIMQNSNVPSENQYKKLLEEASRKKSTTAIPSYEDMYNNSLLILTLVYIIISIQISIPSIKTNKTFPGCIKSFNGYPLNGDTDKSSIIYIACVANKIKSSIKPWNTILKSNEKSLVKKIETIIDKFILKNSTIIELFEEKKKYLIENSKDSSISYTTSILSWQHFLPPLFEYKLKRDKLDPLSDIFLDSIISDFSKGKKNSHMNTLKIKINFYSYYIIELIQNIVKSKGVLLENTNGEPFLQNACCNDINNTIEYFIKNNDDIKKYNDLAIKYSKFLYNINEIDKSIILYDIKNTQIESLDIDYNFSEKIIYKAFIFYCNFDNNIPLSEELRSVCMNKPENYNSNKSIEENIELLKSEGKNYSRDSLYNLLQIINKNNLFGNDIYNNVISNIENLREIINKFMERNSFNELENSNNTFLTKLLKLLDNYSVDVEETLELRNIKNYLLIINSELSKEIIQYFDTNVEKILKSEYHTINSNKININNLNFYKEFISNFINLFPNIIKNKNINHSNIPKHWNLSELHNKDISAIIENYYIGLMEFNYNSSLHIVFNHIKNDCNILIEIFNNIFYTEEIKLLNGNIYSFFDNVFIEQLYKYIINKIIIQLINITKNDNFNIDIAMDYDKDELKRNILDYIRVFIKIYNTNNIIINTDYKNVKHKVNNSKEKEKTLITDFLKGLTDEEREIENIFKNNKLEKWSKGLQKGITQYVKENYDDERIELEKQAVKEKKLGKTDNVTEMNKEIYMMDLEEKELRDLEIEEEEYDMKNIPDDDDYDSDYDYD